VSFSSVIEFAVVCVTAIPSVSYSEASSRSGPLSPSSSSPKSEPRMLDGDNDDGDQAALVLKDGAPANLECYFLLHTDKGKFWIAAKDVQRVDACQLPGALTRPVSTAPEQPPPRRRLWQVGLTVGLVVFVTTLAGVSYVDPDQNLPVRLKGSLRRAIERPSGSLLRSPGSPVRGSSGTNIPPLGPVGAQAGPSVTSSASLRVSPE
jgi:hypothetical protein